MNEFLQYLNVWAGSMVKFVFGPLLSVSFGLPYWLAVLLTVGGMMSSVCLFTFAGTALRKYWQRHFPKKRKVFNTRNRRIVKVWQRYGITGVALLTPLLFTPIGGTLIAVSFGEKKVKIITYMLASGIFWAIVFCGFFMYGKEQLLRFWGN